MENTLNGENRWRNAVDYIVHAAFNTSIGVVTLCDCVCVWKKYEIARPD